MSEAKNIQIEIEVAVFENGENVGETTHIMKLPEALSFQSELNFLAECQAMAGDFAKTCAHAAIWEAAQKIRERQEAIYQAEQAEQEPQQVETHTD